MSVHEAAPDNLEPTSFGFLAFHVYDHDSLDRLLLGLVRPMVSVLARDGRIDRFFFVRFGLGGPHVRLRFRSVGTDPAPLRETIDSMTSAFFAANAQTRTLSALELRHMTDVVLANDPTERDGAIYPNRTVRDAPFEPELERYGGLDVFNRSLDYFAVSSRRALRFLHAHGGATRAKQLPWLLRVLVAEAIGFAGFTDETPLLLAASFSGREDVFAQLIRRGDRLVEEHGSVLLRVLRTDIDAFLHGTSPLGAIDPSATAYDLSSALAGETLATRRRILASHLHMSANRLGLDNAEEVYLGRAASRLVHSMIEERTSLRESVPHVHLEASHASERLKQAAIRALTDS